MKIKRWQLSLIILLIFAFLGVCIYAGIQIFGGNEQGLGKNNKGNTYENGWSKDVVAKIVDEDVPIPDGFEYVSGTKATGLIIQDKTTKAQYLWIPTSLVEENNEDYVTLLSSIFGSKTPSLSPEFLENIEKYGGFYVGVSGDNAVDIAGMTDEEYEQAKLKVAQLYGDSKSVSSVLIAKAFLAGGVPEKVDSAFYDFWWNGKPGTKKTESSFLYKDKNLSGSATLSGVNGAVNQFMYSGDEFVIEEVEKGEVKGEDEIVLKGYVTRYIGVFDEHGYISASKITPLKIVNSKITQNNHTEFINAFRSIKSRGYSVFSSNDEALKKLYIFEKGVGGNTKSDKLKYLEQIKTNTYFFQQGVGRYIWNKTYEAAETYLKDSQQNPAISTTQKPKENESKYENVNETVYATKDVEIHALNTIIGKVLGKLEKGKSITRTGKGNSGWDRVNYNGQVGYIENKYLSKSKPKTEDISTTKDDLTGTATPKPTSTSKPTQTGSNGSTGSSVQTPATQTPTPTPIPAGTNKLIYIIKENAKMYCNGKDTGETVNIGDPPYTLKSYNSEFVETTSELIGYGGNVSFRREDVSEIKPKTYSLQTYNEKSWNSKEWDAYIVKDTKLYVGCNTNSQEIINISKDWPIRIKKAGKSGDVNEWVMAEVADPQNPNGIGAMYIKYTGYIKKDNISQLWSDITPTRTCRVKRDTSVISSFLPGAENNEIIKLTEKTEVEKTGSGNGQAQNWSRIKVGDKTYYIEDADIIDDVLTTDDTRTNLEKILANEDRMKIDGTAIILQDPTKEASEEELKPLSEDEVKQKYGNQIATVYEDKNGDRVPIPKGFSYYSGKTVKEGISVVYDSSKETNNDGTKSEYRLKYVWVPVGEDYSVQDIENTVKELKEYYEKADVNFGNNKLEETLPDDLKKSIEVYGGFYMSEAELGFDDNGSLYNRWRGMQKLSNGWGYSEIGDYFRTFNSSTIKGLQIKNYPSWVNDSKDTSYSFNSANRKLSYSGAVRICEKSFLSKLETGEEPAVISHLTYGAEWDAAVLWLLKTNENYIEDIILDSTDVGKYISTSTWDIMNGGKSLNGLYGLGGNLAELTQETIDGNVVTRGGAYNDKAKESPIASRKALMDNSGKVIAKNQTINQDSVGFRNCLYIKVSEGQEKPVETTEKANAPILGKGMTAVKWDNSNSKWVEVKNPDKDTSWYSYDKEESDTRIWANAKTEDGSMWVWIPRFEYRINDNKIEVNFIKGTSTKATNKYTIHPAFTSDVDNGGWDIELSGIWVAKYEASGDIRKGEISFKAGEESLKHKGTISDAYTLSREFNETLNSHLMKNSEWGAVAYLTHSKYGRNGEEIRQNTTQETGNPNESASTTGNVSGVYDMSGGVYEYVACYYDRGNIKENGKSLVTENNESTKYVTVYDGKRVDTAYIKGDATNETKGWNNDFGNGTLFDSENPFLIRGGAYISPQPGVFAYALRSGTIDSVCGFRAVLVVEGENSQGQSNNPKVSQVTGVETSYSNLNNKTDANITWNKIENVDGYEVYSKLATGVDSTFTVDNNILQAKTLTGLPDGRNIFKVRAYKTINGRREYGEWSKEAIFISVGKVRGVKSSYLNDNKKSDIKITWEKRNDVDGYEVSYKLSAGTSTPSTDTNEYTITNLPSGGCVIKVRAYKEVDNKKIYGEYSDEVKIET